MDFDEDKSDPDPAILALPNLKTLPPLPLHVLPGIAARADVLVMPYADLPVTRAMQPLKLKEYLATGKPVVVNRLPATEPWSDCLDTADTPEDFSRLVRERILSGLPLQQQSARVRLEHESWHSKAEFLLKVVNDSDRKPEDTERPQFCHVRESVTEKHRSNYSSAVSGGLR